MSPKTNMSTMNSIMHATARGVGRTRLLVVIFLSLLLTLPFLASTAFTQQPAADRAERFRKMSVDAETKGTGRALQSLTTHDDSICP